MRFIICTRPDKDRVAINIDELERVEESKLYCDIHLIGGEKIKVLESFEDIAVKMTQANYKEKNYD